MNFLYSGREKIIYRSVKFKISLAYSLLALVNISIFTILIFENQLDLIINNFKLHYDNFASVISKNLSDQNIDIYSDGGRKNFKQKLYVNGITDFIILDENLFVLEDASESENLQLNNEVKKFIESFSNSSKGNKYRIELDKEKYLVKICFYIKTVENLEYFLYTEETIRIVNEKLNQLYIQIGVVIFIGITFHAFFGFYLYRLIFARLSILKEASNSMRKGDLSKRAIWDSSTYDELDDLGNSFNDMASTIQNKVNEITKLNEEIQIELEIGKEVQGFFIPETKLFEKNNIAIQFRPMREVSGDIYNFYKFKDGSRGLFFADAMGHGVPAALVTTVINLGLHIITRQTNNPSKIMTLLNSYLSFHLKSSYYASGIFILFPANEDCIYYTNAAQNDPLIFRDGLSEPIQLSSMGFNLGMIHPFEYPQARMDFVSGDKLVIYSDGVTEAKNYQNTMFGNPKLNEIIGQNLIHSNAVIGAKIIEELEDFTGNYFDDDVTVIILDK